MPRKTFDCRPRLVDRTGASMRPRPDAAENQARLRHVRQQLFVLQ